MQLTLPQLKQQPPSQALYISINSWDVLIIVIYGFAQVIILMLMQIWLLYNTNQEVRMITSIYVKCEACDLQGGSSEAALPLWIPLLLLLHNSSPSPSTAHYFGDNLHVFSQIVIWDMALPSLLLLKAGTRPFFALLHIFFLSALIFSSILDLAGAVGCCCMPKGFLPTVLFKPLENPK